MLERPWCIMNYRYLPIPYRKCISNIQFQQPSSHLPLKPTTGMLQYLPLPHPRIPQSHHAPHLPSEALWTSFYGRRAGHVSSACTVAIQMWLPFCPALLRQNGSFQTKCFTGLQSVAEDFDCCRQLLQHYPELAKAAK